MPEYTPNSHRYKEQQRKEAAEKKKMEKVVTGVAKVKKKSEISKVAGAIISEDLSNVKTHVISDVIIPAAKKLIYDIVKDGIDMLLYGGTGRSDKRSTGSKVSYAKFYDDPRDRHTSSSTVTKTRFDYDDISFENRGDAEMVLKLMEEAIERYGFVTVADMYDLADLTQPYTSNKYGWINLNTAEVVRSRDGYIIKLPRAVPID